MELGVGVADRRFTEAVRLDQIAVVGPPSRVRGCHRACSLHPGLSIYGVNHAGNVLDFVLVNLLKIFDKKNFLSQHLFLTLTAFPLNPSPDNFL